MYYFYTLKSLKDKKYYFGVTRDPYKRLQEHNNGKNKSTKYRRPFVLVLIKTFLDKNAAYKYEWQVKHNGDINKQLKIELAELAEVVKARV